MYAIIETGGKQYHVSPGEELRVEKLAKEVGDPVEFDKVIAVATDDGRMLAGPDLRSARVTGTVSGHGRGKKIVVYKFKRRKQYRRKQGHRQPFSQVQVTEITV